MLISNLPTLVGVAFGSSAGAGYINAIPVASQTGVGDGSAASMTTGFPPVTFEDKASGGIPPHGEDFNGILNLGSTIDQWLQAGGGYTYNSAFSTAISGYPLGAVLQRSDATGGWISTVDGNTTDPDTGGAGWLPYGGSTAILAVTLAGSNVTLTALQAASQIIVLSGTLTANVNLVFPAWVSTQWIIVNNTTGAYTVTAKTASGSGVSIVGTVSVYCTSAGIESAATSGGTVTSVSVTPANGVSAANVGTSNAPIFAFTLGAITPSSVAATGPVGSSANFTSSSTSVNLNATGSGTVNLRPNGAGVTTGQTTISSSGNLVAAGTITPGSDERVKNNIIPIANALATVREAFVGVEYDRNDQDGAHEAGFIAQRVKEHLPHLVHVTETHGFKDFHSMNYNGSTAYLSAAITELHDIVIKQQAMIDALMAK